VLQIELVAKIEEEEEAEEGRFPSGSRQRLAPISPMLCWLLKVWESRRLGAFVACTFPHDDVCVWSLESGIWSLESGAWNLESGVWTRSLVCWLVRLWATIEQRDRTDSTSESASYM
jgi:hypothetical protein